MTWEIKKHVDALAAVNDKFQSAAKTVKLEIDRLAIQMCPYCSGYGHSGNDCPTDHKLSNLREGVREQVKIVAALRKQARQAV